jgi:hypothetical protein
MYPTPHRLAISAGIGMLVLSLLGGCSAFQSSRAIDMNPFAENTAAMFAEAAKVGRPAKWHHLKPYAGTPEVQMIRHRAEPTILGLRGIVMYSNQLVALNMSAKTDKEKNRLLAAYFREAAARVADKAKFDSLGISPSMMDTVFASIERAPTFREGIEAASPLVNGIVLAILRRLDEIDATVPVVIGAIDRQIESEYAAKRQNHESLVRLQTQFQQAVTLLYDGRTGDRDAIARLLEVDPSMREHIPAPEKATPKEFDAAETALTERLAKIDSFLRQLDGEKAVYFAKQQELENLRFGVDERLKIARDAIMVWAQSHRNLGAGIAVPPLIDVGGIAGGLAKKVVPLP